LLLTGSWQQRIAVASGSGRGGKEVAAAGGWREVAVTLEDGSVNGGGCCNEGGGRFLVPLFLSSLTFSLSTLHFSEYLKRRA
jgi:hypothetical protein